MANAPQAAGGSCTAVSVGSTAARPSPRWPTRSAGSTPPAAQLPRQPATAGPFPCHAPPPSPQPDRPAARQPMPVPASRVPQAHAPAAPTAAAAPRSQPATCPSATGHRARASAHTGFPPSAGRRGRSRPPGQRSMPEPRKRKPSRSRPRSLQGRAALADQPGRAHGAAHRAGAVVRDRAVETPRSMSCRDDVYAEELGKQLDDDIAGRRPIEPTRHRGAGADARRSAAGRRPVRRSAQDRPRSCRAATATSDDRDAQPSAWR